jgi:hypothetical protein
MIEQEPERVQNRQKKLRYSRPFHDWRYYKEPNKVNQTEGFDLEFVVLIFDVVCFLTGECNFRNAYWTIEMLRNYERINIRTRIQYKNDQKSH